MSRLSQATTAVRPSLKARMLLGGPTGSGKTRGSLLIATVLAGDGKILVIDTEKESALTYADDFTFTHLPWRPPYHPGELGDTLIEAGQEYAVIVVDSVSHFWQKEGGTLDIAEGKFTGWKDARPVQERFVEGVLNSAAHVILCARAKTEYVQETDSRGRQVVRKIGMGIKQDSELGFEVNVEAELAMDHTATITKSRTTVLPVLEVWPGHRWTELAQRYKDWLAGGEPPADAKTVKGLVEELNALPEEVRKTAKADWVAKLGRPDTLRANQLEAAKSLVTKWVTDHAPNGTDQGGLGTTAAQDVAGAVPDKPSGDDGHGAQGEPETRTGAVPPVETAAAARPSASRRRASPLKPPGDVEGGQNLTAPSLDVARAPNLSMLQGGGEAAASPVEAGFVTYSFARNALAGAVSTRLADQGQGVPPEQALEYADEAMSAHGLKIGEQVSRSDLEQLREKVAR